MSSSSASESEDSENTPLPIRNPVVKPLEAIRRFSSEESCCRICLSEEPREFITPCECKGTQKYVHEECLNDWRIRYSSEHVNRVLCRECKTLYDYDLISEPESILSDDSESSINNSNCFREFLLGISFIFTMYNSVALILLFTIPLQSPVRTLAVSVVLTASCLNLLLIPLIAAVIGLSVCYYIFGIGFIFVVIWHTGLETILSLVVLYVFSIVTISIFILCTWRKFL